MIYYILALNLVSFSLCGFDKRQALAHGYRVQERIFYLLALLGGTYGIIAAMGVFRHKTRKPSFQWPMFLLAFFQIWILFVIAR